MKKTIICLAIAATMLQSCALVFSGRKDKVKVKGGMPETAKVYYNGELVGTGSCKVKVHKKSIETAVIEVKADGYKTQTFKFSKKLKVGALLADCIGFIWLIPDFATGAIYKATPQTVHYDLQISDEVIKTDLKQGDRVIFSYQDYKNVEGEVKLLYPNRAIIGYTKKNGKTVDFEVPLINITKK